MNEVNNKCKYVCMVLFIVVVIALIPVGIYFGMIKDRT